ncbi:MAG: outer membrane beta-barrel protein [Bacteriovoracia bacterium]
MSKKQNIQFRGNKLNQIFGAAMSCLLLASLVLAASPFSAQASSWAQKPAWATGSPSSGSSTARRALSREENLDISPYSPGSHNLALDLGQVFLMGDLGNKYNDNIGFQAHYTYGVSDMFGFDTSLGYSSHREGDLSMTSLLAGLRTNLSWFDRIIPYVVFGLGFYRPSERIAGTSSSVSAFLFGLHLGPGVDLQLTKNLFFGTALTFHDIFGTTTTDSKGVAHELGGTYTSFLLHAGVTF